MAFIVLAFQFYLPEHANGRPFAVDMLRFDLLQIEDSVEIRWTTATETNSDRFLLQRSADGFTYTDVCVVRAAGNSIQQQSYVFRDKPPLNGNYYYRLRQHDADGSATSYPPRLLSYQSGAVSFAVGWQPGGLLVSINAGSPWPVSIAVFTLEGTVLATAESVLVPGDNKIVFDFAGTAPPAGPVVVRAATDRQAWVKKLAPRS